MVLLAGVEVIHEYAIKMPILTLTISNWTDYFKVEMSHYVPRLIMYRPTLLHLLSSVRLFSPSVRRCSLCSQFNNQIGELMGLRSSPAPDMD
jgi:hypothetical protein